MIPSRHICLAVLLAAPSVLAAADDRITAPINPARTVTVRGQVHSHARAQNDQGPVDPTFVLPEITVLMHPSPTLEPFLAELQNPASPNYHGFVTPEEFADRFGLSTGDIDQVVHWLQAEGLTVHRVARGRHWITFGGDAVRVGRALHTQFHRYAVNGEVHVANAADPSVPEALQGVVAGFDGLNDFPDRPLSVRAQLDSPQFNSGTSHFLAPDDVATIYNVKPLLAAGVDGTGVSIAVIGQTRINLSDIQSFRKRFNLPANDPEIVLVGTDPGIRSSDLPEADLDIEWSGAVARNAHIIYIYSSSVRTSAQYAVDQNVAPIMTYSYGACEQSNSVALRYVAQQANAQGITWMVSSGDAGSATCDYFSVQSPVAAKGSTLSYPANVPEITAVGGTQFNEGSDGARYWAATNDANGASALSYIPEKVWNESVIANGFVASGGGPSAYFAKPYWQTGPGVPDDKARDIPDISLSAAASHVGYEVFSNGGVQIFGGTSVSAPAFAGMVALLNQSLVSKGTIAQPGLGNINPTLYRLAQSTKEIFHDIVDGDNKVPCVQSSPNCVNGMLGYAAGPGYDLSTGLGTVDAFNLVTKWNIGSASTTTLSADQTTVDLAGVPVKLTATVKGGGSVLPTGTVTFLANNLVVGTVSLAPSADRSAAVATLSVNPGMLVSGNGVVTALFGGDGVYNNSAGMVTIKLNVASAGSLVLVSISPNPVPQIGTSWPYTVTLTEKAGVATKITGFTVNGADNAANIPALGNGNISAKGSVSAAFSGTTASITTVPLDRTFVFTGQDADGTKWTRQLTVPFVAALGPVLAPSISLTSTASAIQQNPAADPACQWSQEVVLEERGGYLVILTAFTGGTGVNFTPQIQQLFGTTRLAPYGSLRARICWDKTTTAGSTKTLTVTGTAESGVVVNASTTVSFQGPATAAAVFSVSSSTFALSAAPSKNVSAPLELTFNGASPRWSVSLPPANRSTSWLKVSPAAGIGSATISVQALSAGLSAGAYQGLIVVDAPGSQPQTLTIPISFVVGGSSTTVITGACNAAACPGGFAPGALVTIYGKQLAPTAQQSNRIPLPYGMLGVSATVNGVNAPLFYVGPDQVNLQIPYEAGVGPSVLAINNNGEVATFPITIAVAAPRLFGVLDARSRAVTTAQAGQILSAYITGDGDVNPFLPSGAALAAGTPASRLSKTRLPVVVTVGGFAADVAFVGIPASVVGVTQINFAVPATVPPGVQDLVVTVGGVPSQVVKLIVTP